MKRIILDDKVTVRGRKCGRALTPSTRETSKTLTPLRPLNQGGVLRHRRQSKYFGQQSDVPEVENRPVARVTVGMSDRNKATMDWKRLKMVESNSTKAKLNVEATKASSRNGRDRDNDLKKTLSHMEEKFTSASEELQAAEEELTELRVALSNAKRTIEALRVENAGLVEKIKVLTTESRENEPSGQRQRGKADIGAAHAFQTGSILKKYSNENKMPSAESLFEQNRSLQKLVDEIAQQKVLLEFALESSKEEVSRVMLENKQLKLAMETERKEWDQMQKDLLVAVKVANDFKVEAQKEMMRLSEKITELQKRRQSTPFNVSHGSLMAMFEEKPRNWEDKAWHRLMLGCERGSRRNALLRWCQQAVAKFPHVEITNFSSSWADGRALCFLLAAFYPDKLNADNICSLGPEECLKLALSVASLLGVEVKVQVADFRRDDRPDWSLIMRYILNLYYVMSDGSNC